MPPDKKMSIKSLLKPSEKKPKGIDPLVYGDVKELLDAIRKEVGSESIQLAGGTDLDVSIRGVVSTQCVGIDEAIGRGGIPLGRLTILHGPEGCGKTTLALHIAAEVQRTGGICIYMDLEYKLDMEYAAKIGVNRNHMLLSQPDTLEKVFAAIKHTIEHAKVLRKRLKRRVPIVVILDSMNAAITEAQFKGEWEAHHIAPQARVYSKCLPKLMPIVYKEDVALVWISQVRQKMNVKFGNDEEIAGGNGPRFYASLIIHLKRIGSIKSGEDIIGNKTIADVRKNQVAPPFKKCEFIIRYGHGIDNERSVLDIAIGCDIVEKSGSWINYKEEKLGCGLEAASHFLRQNPKVFDSILKDIQGK